MARPLISESLNTRLDELVTKLFAGNRICDRAMSILDLKFVMNNTVKFLHPKLAHLYPALADMISDYQGARNVLTVYGLTPLDDTDYSSPLDYFNRMIDYMIELETLCSEICEFASEDNDYTTKVFIESFLLKLIPVTKQCLLLADKAEKYGSDLMGFDSRIEDWITL